MAVAVLLTEAAARDLEELVQYVERHDSPARADHVLAKIEVALAGLGEQPHRGVYPPELAALGVREYREVFFKPYRIIYRVIDDRVYVLLIADGRRDLQTLLQRRLLSM